MKILVIGLGSMGRRRVRLLQKVRASDIIIGIDNSEERRAMAERELKIVTNDDLKATLCDEVEYAFVCTSPLSHAAIINQCLKGGMSVFTEINLVDDLYEENTALAKKKGKLLYLSSTPFFRSEVKYITNLVQDTKGKLGYIYHVGQYLPDWHPWENYKDFFIGNKRTNGCREILAIELPWLVHCFGNIVDVQVLAGKKTDLAIEYPDYYSVLITHESGHHGTFAVDVVCRKAVRYFEVYGENLYLTWDGTADGLRIYDTDNKEEHMIDFYEQTDHLPGYNSMIIENAYEDEIIDFFETAEHGKKQMYSFEQDKTILNWIDRIESYV